MTELLDQLATDPPALQPRDGFRVTIERFSSGDALRVILYLRSGGNDLWNMEVVGWPRLDLKSVGEAQRLHLLLEAVCRYCNTGGNYTELLSGLEALDPVQPGMKGFCTLTLPDLFLVQSRLEEGNYVHTFMREDSSQPGLHWVEGITVDPITLDELKESLELEENLRDEARFLKTCFGDFDAEEGGTTVG